MIKYAQVAIPVPLNTDFTYSYDSEELDIVPGVRVYVPFGKNGKKTKGYVVSVCEEKPDVSFEIKSISKQIDKEPIFTKDLWDLALWMEKFYFSSRGEVLDTMVPGGKKDVSYGGFDSELAEERPSVELTDEQKSAVKTVIESDSKMFYLFGVTGSGKTEVFLNCAEKIIEQGGQVIYLVPEITLTHQLALQVIKRFKNNVAILHSALTDAQRVTQWRRIKSGEVKLVIGARSAVFAPCENLKLIIIDEEHETSYKSGNNPRYHARQVAQKRLSMCGGKLLMGSATPSLEAWNLMKDPSKMTRIDLTHRVGKGSMPKVTITDMKGCDSIFSEELVQRMNDVLSRGKQVILFLNRRGFSYFFHCKSCGYELKCPHCDVAMTYHKKSHTLVCHYCGYHQKPITVCPQCHSMDVMYSGFGTEQVEAELKNLFPNYRSARLDTDVVSSDRKVIQQTLDDFKRGDIKILLGTQMVAKGLNFPNVQLVGIIMADSGLLIPDFRAEERTFDLLVQVSGRSGRADSEGQVIIQTRLKDNSAITYASNMQVQEFFDRELNIRKETGFPPFSRMINIVARSRNRVEALDYSKALASKLRELSKNFEVYGAQECPIEKIRENWRFQVLMKSYSTNDMISALYRAMNEVKVPSSTTVEVDVDPLELM